MNKLPNFLPPTDEASEASLSQRCAQTREFRAFLGARLLSYKHADRGRKLELVLFSPSGFSLSSLAPFHLSS